MSEEIYDGEKIRDILLNASNKEDLNKLSLSQLVTSIGKFESIKAAQKTKEAHTKEANPEYECVRPALDNYLTKLYKEVESRDKI